MFDMSEYAIIHLSKYTHLSRIEQRLLDIVKSIEVNLRNDTACPYCGSIAYGVDSRPHKDNCAYKIARAIINEI